MSLALPARVTEGTPGLEGRIDLAEPAPAWTNADLTNLGGPGLAVVIQAVPVVQLVSSDPSVLAVPSSVTVPPGGTSVAFPIQAPEDPRLLGSRRVVVTATMGFDTQTVPVVVDDRQSATLRLFLPARAREGDGVLAGAGAVAMDKTPDGPVSVELTSMDTNALGVPATVVIPAGQTTALFDVTVVDNALFDGPHAGVVMARVQNWQDDLDALLVEDNEAAALSLVIPAQAEETAGLLSKAGIVRIGGALSTNLVVGLACSPSGVVLAPQTVVIPPGQLECVFDIRVLDNIDVSGPRSVVVTARTGGFAQASAAMTVADDEMPAAPAWPFPTHGASRVSSPIQLGWGTDRPEILGAVVYDIYLGTNPVLSQADYLGSTLETNWFVPVLPLNTPVYWQIVVSKDGQLLAGPVWQFVTADLGGFEWSGVPAAQQTGTPFEASLAAKDENGAPAQGYGGAAALSALSTRLSRSTLLITEVDTANNDQIEFANVSDRPLDASGWAVYLYDWITWPEPRVAFRIPAGAVCKPGEVFTLRKRAAQYCPGIHPAYYYAVGIGWNNNPNFNPMAVMLCDDQGAIIDFMCAVDIQPGQIVNPVAVASEQWRGAPMSANTGATLTYQRKGNSDRNDATDWAIAPASPAAVNPGLTLPFKDAALAGLAPEAPVSFTNGVWSGPVTFLTEGREIVLRALESQGRQGLSGPVNVSALDSISMRLEGGAARMVLGRATSQTIIVSNSGPSAATGVEFAALLGDGSSAPPSSVSYTVSQGVSQFAQEWLRWSVGTLAGGASAQVRVGFTPRETGGLTNRFSVTRAEPGPRPAASIEWTGRVQLAGISITNTWVREGAAGGTNLVFPVQLSDPCDQPVRVGYATADGSALSGADYQAASGTLVFPPGTTNLALTVAVVGNTLYESNKVLYVTLSRPENAVLIYSNAFGVITNDDGMPGVKILGASATEGDEGLSTVVFPVVLTALSGKPVDVAYATSDVTARAGLDYLPAAGHVRFAPGASNATVSVSVLGNRVWQPDRSFLVKLSYPSEAYIAAGQASGVILDDDAGKLHHFSWGPLGALQYAGVPMDLTLNACDAAGRLLESFNEPVPLRAVSGRQTVSVGAGSLSLDSPMAAGSHDNRLQTLYLASELARSGRISALALNVLTRPGQVLSNWTIRLKMVGLTNLAQAGWHAEGWTTVHQDALVAASNGWTAFQFQTPFDYVTPSNLLVDFSFNNCEYSADGALQATAVTQTRSLALRTDSGFGDPLLWSGTIPVPGRTNLFPNTRFSFETPAGSTLPAAASFAGGVWTGAVAMLLPAQQVWLAAAHPRGPMGFSAPFDVLLLDSDADGIPDDWEIAHGLNPNDPSDAASDPDQDGMTNLQEYLAGTDPHSPESLLRIASVQQIAGGACLTFQAAPSKRYQLEAAASLAPGAWEVVGETAAGPGGQTSLTNLSSAPWRFYRLKLLP